MPGGDSCGPPRVRELSPILVGSHADFAQGLDELSPPATAFVNTLDEAWRRLQQSDADHYPVGRSPPPATSFGRLLCRSPYSPTRPVTDGHCLGVGSPGLAADALSPFPRGLPEH